jgi:DNA-binding transcriptional LysR family regulator
MDKFRAIQYFNRAVETGSLAAAGRALGVSTPAVSELLTALERSLGVRLFNRNPRGLSLTADGERYSHAARKIAADLSEMELAEIFAEIESQRVPAYNRAVPRVPQPPWFGRARGRQSTYRAAKSSQRGR